MPRPLRSDPEGGWHHVMNRGVNRMTIYADDLDRRWFMDLLVDAARNSRVEVLAYCQVGNHFHLLVHCPYGGLSRFMWKLSAEYARVYNKRHARDGPVFRGRFASKQVCSDEYAVTLLRYIHRNSLDIGVQPAAWPWSSYQAYAGLVRAPSWLHVGDALRIAGGSEQHRAFVAMPLPFDARMHANADPAELHRSWVTARAAAAVHDSQGLIDRLGLDLSDRQRRDATILVAVDAGLKPPDLAAALGVASVSSVRSRVQRARERRASDHELATAVAQITRALPEHLRSAA